MRLRSPFPANAARICAALPYRSQLTCACTYLQQVPTNLRVSHDLPNPHRVHCRVPARSLFQACLQRPMARIALPHDSSTTPLLCSPPKLRRTMMRCEGRGWYTRDRQPRKSTQAKWGQALETSLLPRGLASRGVREACGLRRCRSVG